MMLQVGVKVLLKSDDNKYLFLKRAASFGSGGQQWDIPGGRINVDESLDDALRREVREETDLELEQYELVAAQDIFAPDKDIHVVRLTYIGLAPKGKITISDEHAEYTWMTRDEAIKQPLDSYLAVVFEGSNRL